MIGGERTWVVGRVVRHDTSEENMKLLWSYLEKFGRPVASIWTRRVYFRRRRSVKRMSLGWIKTLWRCRRHRLGAGYGNWGSPGLPRILPRRRDEWRGISKRHKIAW